MKKIKLGLNVDHVATLREARGTSYPNPALAALLAEYAGCDSIVVHLREDRRHIKEYDVLAIKEAIKIPLNLEMSVDRGIVAFAKKLLPDQATLVPEKRQELTTEGGIDLITNYNKVRKVIEDLKKADIKVSLFIDPVLKQVNIAKDLGADIVEISTARFSEMNKPYLIAKEIQRIKKAVSLAKKIGLSVAAGHGLDYENVNKIINISGIEELNIGHSIICRSVFTGIVAAVEEMFSLINNKK
ncbi:MAG: pyridoxine 5'-phosphate synthase [Candidatus Omnitrophica bacterium]|nr:pyridoxine 5'-phosphate synthase [Candidatus Omnitrophota bacterium]